MADLTQPVKTALARYWSEIFGGAAAGLTTADLFNNIRDRASSLGLASVGVSATAVSTLRGYASSMIRTAASLGRASDESALTSAHISQTPWSRSITEQNTMPIYQIGFDHTIQLDDGSQITKRQTISVTGALPSTVGALRDFVSGEASLMAAEGGAADSGTPHGTSLGVDNLMLMAL